MATFLWESRNLIRWSTNETATVGAVVFDLGSALVDSPYGQFALHFNHSPSKGSA